MASEMNEGPKLVVDTVEYPLVMPDDMTMREQVEFEKIAGAGVDALERLEEDYRAAVVMAWMAVSIKREKPQTPMRQITARLEEFKPAELQSAWEGVVAKQGEAGQSPPEVTEEPKPIKESSVRALEIAPGLGTLVGTGNPGSEVSESDPETLAN